jgi:hypothetical protein
LAAIWRVARERQGVIRDGDGEVLGHFIMVDNATDRERNLVLAAQRFLGALRSVP